MKMSCKTLFGIAAGLNLASAATAATFYVDNVNGNDAYSGYSHTYNGKDGPWMSMARVMAAKLAPGDIVRFRCGQVWRDALEPKISGAPGNPITYGSYPLGCTNKPRISGLTKLAAYNWSQDTDGSWVTPWPANMVKNGLLTSNYDGWRIWSQDSSARLQTPSTCTGSSERCLAIVTSTASGLASSTSFEIDGGKNYRLSFQARVESKQSLKAIVRQDGDKYATLGLVSPAITGGGQWATYTYTFAATNSRGNARLDFEVPAGQTVYVKNVQLLPATPIAPSMLSIAAFPLEPAHHPNRGYDTSKPGSPYLLTTARSTSYTDQSGQLVSDFIKVDPKLPLPGGGVLTPGLGITVRNNMWALSSHKIASISSDGTQINLDSTTRYPLNFAGQGYYFTGARWMLDSNGEWFYDEAKAQLAVRMPGAKAPEDKTSYGALPIGINLKTLTNITLDNLMIEGAATGVLAMSTDSVVMKNLKIQQVQDLGIDAQQATNLLMDGLEIRQAGMDAIKAWDSNYVTLTNSRIDQIGLSVSGGRLYGMPRHTITATAFNDHATVKGNIFTNLSYGAINVGTNSLAEDNSISDFCLLQSDCGGIILDKGGVGSHIRGNLVQRGLGNIDGLPSNVFYSHAVGVYADNHAHQVVIENNAITGTDFGIQIHDGFQIDVIGNTSYGNRRYQMWIQETAAKYRDQGDIYDITVRDNNFFPTIAPAIVRHGSSVNNDVADMSTFDGNQYSTMFTGNIVYEYGPSFSKYHTLDTWQKETDANGVPRNLDVNGRIAAPLAGYAVGTMQASILPNATFNDNAKGWSKWNNGGGSPTIGVETCSVVNTKCLKFTAVGSASNLSSPNFSVRKGQFYKYTFDAKASSDNVTITTVLRRAGTASYASLQGKDATQVLGQNWKRYTLVFSAPEDAVIDTQNSNNGARLDFLGVPQDRSIWLANVEVTPIDSNGLAESKSAFFGNDGAQTASYDCPEGAGAAMCNLYLQFPSGSPVSWPISLAPRQSMVVFTQNTSTPDADRDGVADSQDKCANTPSGAAVNATGCEFGR